MKRKILLTGAAGNLGRIIASRLAAAGHELLLADVADYPAPLPEKADFRHVDLADREAMLALAPEVGSILHFGAAATERPFEQIIEPNIIGAHNVFDLARRAKARVLFASSNHAIGFHERGKQLDEACDLRPDGYYGLSKAYGELLARLYWDKHGVESLSIRIGSCLEKPTQLRHLSTWLSHDDLMRLIEAGLAVPSLGCRVVWGVSANRRSWWAHHDDGLGYAPQDDAETYAATVSPDDPDPIAERYQGGPFCAQDYSR